MNCNDTPESDLPQSDEDTMRSVLTESMNSQLRKMYHEIETKWLECMGKTPGPDLAINFGLSHYDAVTEYHRAMSTDDPEEKRTALEWSAEAAGAYVRESIKRGQLENLTKLFKRLNRIKEGGTPRSAEANERIGSALMAFLAEVKRLPHDRDELRSHFSNSENDISNVKPKSLSDALVLYGLHEKIRDKTGPKPRSSFGAEDTP